ncbi:hypothetical protein CGRA01v4_04183 [Colletotrichum graminicola]|uniref:C2H2-type domain-containing protein n=1 Tax=Colletotrichum graminicola (strain M1.001 / M2 / FGSC 10212) TaxID=645133 RepID=E3QVL0_COLGM|nr:uncharacterized protein GLRG_10042 [Colletotrichum graminicola M1.001]EFQ34898.1 hypothetical protein GLRG_10042 [Colletotrichum graminicola M1.001]WDK12902.1 hypothetical protein CGRA01v4_04183 [Colletotrichum graminicola]
MASNAQVATPPGPQHPQANSPSHDIGVSSTSTANNALRNASPSSVSSAGEASGRKMKRTGAVKPLVKPSPQGQAPPPWATSLVDGRGSMGFMATSPSAQAQSNSDQDIISDLGLVDRPLGPDTSAKSRPRSPEHAHVVSDINHPDQEGTLAIKTRAPSPEATPEADMTGNKKTLAGHARIQALQESWESGGIEPGSSAITDSNQITGTADSGKDWLRGDSASYNTMASKKRSLLDGPSGNEAKRKMTAIPLPNFPANTSAQGISTPGSVATELDLLNALSAGKTDRLKATVLRTTEDTNMPPFGTSKPSFITTIKEAPQIIDISEDAADDDDADHTHEDSTDDDETTEDRQSDVLEPQLASTTMQADNPFSQGFHELSLTKDANPRGYLQWRTPQGTTESSCGTILPTNYHLHSDPMHPFVCPVRNCRKIFNKMHALGAHFSIKHRSSTFNDNLDGTLSFIDYYKKAGIKCSPPIVVSQNSLQSNEAPMPEPSRPAAKSATPQLHRESPAQPSQAASSSQPTRPVQNNMELLTYLRSYLSPAYTLPLERPDVKALLKLPRKRPLPHTWRLKYTGVGHLAPLATVALLIYLTGDEAPEVCSVCHQDTNPLENFLQPCIVMADAVPSFLKEVGNKACAGCQWRANFRREKNNCSFLSANIHTSASPATHAEHPTIAPSPPLSGIAKVDKYSLPYSANQGTQPTEPRRSSPKGRLPPATKSAPSAHSSKTSPPGSPPRRVTRHSLAASKVAAGLVSSSATATNVTSPSGNLMPSNSLEMEDWEVAPGRLRDERSESPTNVAFSNSYLTTNQAVTVSEDISFNVIVVKPGDSHYWSADADKVRICSLAMGKLKVKLDNTEPFQMGPNGMFKLKRGMACTVENRLYVDAVVHVTTVSQP